MPTASTDQPAYFRRYSQILRDSSGINGSTSIFEGSPNSSGIMQRVARPDLAFRDRDRDLIFLSLNFETETET